LRTDAHVLTTSRGDLLTIGVVLAIYFSSSGIESVRIGLTVPTMALNAKLVEVAT